MLGKDCVYFDDGGFSEWFLIDCFLLDHLHREKIIQDALPIVGRERIDYKCELILASRWENTFVSLE
jgi:hypothetical protein